MATAQKKAPGVYEGELYRTTGPPFDAVPWDASRFVPTKVGALKLTFADGNNASFEYTVQLAGMAAAVTQSKPITRELFAAGGTTCR